MKLIFITQKLAYGDPLMGFTHAWVTAFARYVDELVVIANEVGEIRLDPQPRIYSLGKEAGHGRFKKALLLNEAIRAESNADAIFCHQCPIYMLTLLPANPLLKIPMYLWYAHGHLSKTARLASVFARKVFTSSPYALTLYNHKKCVIGQGVETNFWRDEHKTFDTKTIRMVHVGRLSAVKNILPMIHLAAELKRQGQPVRLDLIGDPATAEDQVYSDELKEAAVTHNVKHEIRFLGGMPHDQIRAALKLCDFTLNFSTSAAIDKSLIETAAAGLLPISYNESFLHTLTGTPLEKIYQQNKMALGLIQSLFARTAAEKQKLSGDFFAVMHDRHDLDRLARRITETIKTDIKKE